MTWGADKPLIEVASGSEVASMDMSTSGTVP